MSPSLRDEIIQLGPWHLDVEVVPGLNTSVFREAPPETYATFGDVSFIAPRAGFHALLSNLYPDGLQGRRVLDCACNCGGYLFWAKELGAGECFGFDVRQHWIDQARFLNEHRKVADIRFEVADLYDIPKLGLAPFDITIFKGIFYHLPDPVTGLKIAADLARELILVNTATRNGLPDGMLAVSQEGVVSVMSGVYGLNWFPTGPDVLKRILRWMGFPHSRCTVWQEEAGQRENLGRVEVIAGRISDPLTALDRRQPEVTRPSAPEKPGTGAGSPSPPVTPALSASRS